MRLVIDVTQEDIDKGIAQNCRECPIALAGNKTLNTDSKVFTVGNKMAYISDGVTGGIISQAVLPQAAKNIVRAVDGGYREYIRPTKLTLHFTSP